MTQVRISPSILEYRQAMAEAVNQIRKENTISGVKLCSFDQPSEPLCDLISSNPCMAGLLKPSKIEMLDLSASIRDGQLDCLIQVRTSGDFGVMCVCVTITDDQGNLIESDYAMRDEYFMSHWAYILEAEAGAFRSLTVQAIAIDCLGGMGMKYESTTVDNE